MDCGEESERSKRKGESEYVDCGEESERSKRKGKSEYVDCGEESEIPKEKARKVELPRELNQKMWGSSLGRGRENF